MLDDVERPDAHFLFPGLKCFEQELNDMVGKGASWENKGLEWSSQRRKEKEWRHTENLKAAEELIEILHRIGVARVEVWRRDNHLVQVVHQHLQNGVQHARAVENSGTQDIAESLSIQPRRKQKEKDSIDLLP